MKLNSFLKIASNLYDSTLVNRNVSKIVLIIKYMAKDVLFLIKRQLYIYIYILHYDFKKMSNLNDRL